MPYRHARVILRQLEQAQADVEVVGREPAGGVSVGLAAYSTVNALALPLLSAVRARYPRVLFHINENFGGVLSEALMTGRMEADVPLLLPGPTHTIRRVVDKAFAQASTAATSWARSSRSP